MTPELRELLELSARAMGYEPHLDGWFGMPGGVIKWQPHLDKAQCFDMECALGITPEFSEAEPAYDFRENWKAIYQSKRTLIVAPEFTEDHNNDRAKARMMAVLKVAAEIGRRMQ